jgi:hypothetical protein
MQKKLNLQLESGRKKNLISKVHHWLNFVDKHSAADICKNHLKLLEKFCLDDNQFICWMCHNFNYSDEHRGHRVVSLSDAYKVIKKQATLNLNLLERMQNLVQYRVRYTNQCRYDIERDLRKSQKSLSEYIDKIINDLYLLKQQKMDELMEEYKMRDEYMVQNHEALKSLSEEIKKFTDKEPDSLMEALKQYKGTFHIKNRHDWIYKSPHKRHHLPKHKRCVY